MKKKASFWISGITTVAMLATAVGSFAAWESLTASDETLEVATSTPVVLKVTGDTATKDTKVLIPGGMTITDTNKEATEIKVGTVKVELTGTGDNKNVASITKKSAVYDDADRNTENVDYDVVLRSGGTDVTTILPDDIKDADGKTYDVFVKFKDSITNAEAKAGDIGTTKYVKIDLTAVK